MAVGSLWREVFGDPIPREAGRFLRERTEKKFIYWTSRRVVIPVIIEVLTPMIIRHNDPEELFSLDVEAPGKGMVTVPAILGTKVSGELRRRMQQILRDAYALWSGEVDSLLGSAGLPGYKGSYTCMVTVTTRKGGQEEAVVPGYCKRCPACALMGYAVEAGNEVNTISRVDKDTFYSTSRLIDAMVKITRNKVDDISFTTGQALFEANAVKPGTLFVGVITLRDVTEAELLFTLKALSEMERLGAVKTIFGAVRTHIPVVAFSYGRLATGYELAGEIIALGLSSKDEILKHVAEKIAGIAGQDRAYVADVSGIMRAKSIDDLKSVILEAWSDAAVRRKMVLAEAGLSNKTGK